MSSKRRAGQSAGAQKLDQLIEKIRRQTVHDKLAASALADADAIAPLKNELLKRRFFGHIFSREHNALQNAPNTA